MSRVVLTVAIVLIGVAAGLYFAAGRWFGVHGADPTNVALVARGQEVYTQHCAACHGDHLQGQPDWRLRKPDGKLPAPPHDESGHTWHHPDPQLFDLTKFGLQPFAPPGYQSDMPAFDDKLSDPDIWAVLAFIKSRWPADIRARQAQITAQAAGR